MQKSTFTRAGWGHNGNHLSLVQSDVGIHQNGQKLETVTVTFLQIATFEHDGSALRIGKLWSVNLRDTKTRVGICGGHFFCAWITCFLLSSPRPIHYLDASMLPLVADTLRREKLAMIVCTTGQKGSCFCPKCMVPES